MLRYPETMIAPFLGLARQLDGVAQGLCRAFRFVYRALVEYAQLQVQGGPRRLANTSGRNPILHHRIILGIPAAEAQHARRLVL